MIAKVTFSGMAVNRNCELGRVMISMREDHELSLIRALGLMSGTSMDAVDVALVETDGERSVTLGASRSFPYRDEDRALLRVALADACALDDRDARPGALEAAEAMITERHAEAVESFLDSAGLQRETVDVIGFHGQTVLHRPERRLTVQIGDGAALASRLGIEVAYDFRAVDVAGGGQGAPLVPAFHRALVEAAGFTLPVAVINIGGVANLSFIAPGEEPIACDCGPGNALLDDLMLQRTGVAIDRDGVVAASGTVDEAALRDLLANEFFKLPPPKSLDRNDFSSAPVDRLKSEDAAATLTAFTAAGIAATFVYLPSSPSLAIICGGGARNPVLMRELSQRLPCRIASADDFGWSADAMEAQAFAYLAVRRLKNLPITFPMTTGIDRPMPGGILASPSPLHA